MQEQALKLIKLFIKVLLKPCLMPLLLFLLPILLLQCSLLAPLLDLGHYAFLVLGQVLPLELVLLDLFREHLIL